MARAAEQHFTLLEMRQRYFGLFAAGFRGAKKDSCIWKKFRKNETFDRNSWHAAALVLELFWSSG
jgi:hypothetical protein